MVDFFVTQTVVDDGIPTPGMFYRFLCEWVIGQETAKETLAIAAHNHYKRVDCPEAGILDQDLLTKSNIILVGPTGCGKTQLARAIARALDKPFMIANATSLTAAGYVGDDVESILAALLDKADGDVAEVQKAVVFIDEIDKLASTGEQAGAGSGVKDVGGTDVQYALLKLIEGAEVVLPQTAHKRKVTIDTKDILFIVGGAFSGIDKIITRRVTSRAAIGFGAEAVDKVEEKDLYLLTTHEDIRSYGIIPELAGRLPIIAPLSELTEDELVRVMTEPKGCTVDQARELFARSGVGLEFAEDALRAIAKQAKVMGTGARGLDSVIDRVLHKLQFTAFEDGQPKSFLITEGCVNGTEDPVRTDRVAEQAKG